MRLIKLLAYCLLGYVAYEFYQGLKEGRSVDDRYDHGRGRDDLGRALDEDPGRMMNMTGPGRGMSVSTEDASGMSAPHLVGRGVVQ